MKRTSLAIAASAIVTFAGMQAYAGEHLKVEVSPMRSFAPSTLTVRVTVPPTRENRQLEIVADSENFYRSSIVQLEGTEGPPVVSVEFRAVPGGDYTVAAIVRDGSGHELGQEHREVTVVASGAEQ